MVMNFIIKPVQFCKACLLGDFKAQVTCKDSIRHHKVPLLPKLFMGYNKYC